MDMELRVVPTPERTSTTMVAPAVVEQQAKLGVSAEESKAERLKRQQARFRDRGGAFVPSTSNPLVDILLARTVSGESPSKPRTKHVAKRPSLSKPRRSSPTRKANAPASTQTVAGSSKSRPVPRKGKTKAAQPEVDPDSKPAPKRRGRPPQSKKKVPDPDSDAEQLPSTNAKSKRTSKGNAKQRVAASTLDAHPKPKSKPKVKTKPAKEVVEVFDSDHDQTVDVPRKPKSNPKKIIPHEDDDESDDDAPIIKKRAVLRADDSKASSTKTTRVKTTGKKKGMGRAEPVQDAVELVEMENDERPPEHVSKLKKRKKEDNYDDRPRKVVKFSEPGPPHASSHQLKENQPDKKRAAKSRIQDEPNAPEPELVVDKPPARAKTPKGPPRKVLARIKASVARHLRCNASEPDELDCLS